MDIRSEDATIILKLEPDNGPTEVIWIWCGVISKVKEPDVIVRIRSGKPAKVQVRTMTPRQTSATKDVRISEGWVRLK